MQYVSGGVPPGWWILYYGVKADEHLRIYYAYFTRVSAQNLYAYGYAISERLNL